MEKNIEFKKSLGQNFIFDKNLLMALAKDGGLGKDDVVLEIGAGAGTLTDVLADVAKEVISFEIDTSLKPYLDKVQEKHDNLKIIYQDFMEADISTILKYKAKVIANIPYYITTPIVFKLVDNIKMFESILILVQKEVAIRFASPAKCKDYGITSVILQSIFDIDIPRIVKKECFTPAPKVDSALCRLIPHEGYNISNFADFKDFIHLAFSMRRKTLVNNLKSKYDKDFLINKLHELGLDERVRPEDITVENYIKLFNFLK